MLQKLVNVLRGYVETKFGTSFALSYPLSFFESRAVQRPRKNGDRPDLSGAISRGRNLPAPYAPWRGAKFPVSKPPKKNSKGPTTISPPSAIALKGPSTLPVGVTVHSAMGDTATGTFLSAFSVVSTPGSAASAAKHDETSMKSLAPHTLNLPWTPLPCAGTQKSAYDLAPSLGDSRKNEIMGSTGPTRSYQSLA